MKKEKIIERAVFHPNEGRYEIPPEVPPPRDEIYKIKVEVGADPSTIPVAGIDTHGLQVAVQHQTIGMLPGPGAKDYKQHSFKRTRDDSLGAMGISEFK